MYSFNGIKKLFICRAALGAGVELNYKHGESSDTHGYILNDILCHYVIEAAETTFSGFMYLMLINSVLIQ